MSKKPKCEPVVPTHRCDDCDWEGVETDITTSLCQIHHLWDRLTEGGVVPSGECPECGALCYLLPDEAEVKVELVREAAPALLAAALAAQPALEAYSNSGHMDEKFCDANGYSKPLALLNTAIAAAKGTT